MVKTIARQVIKEDYIEQYQVLAKELVEETRKEPGCIAYSTNQSLKDKRVHCFIEVFVDQAAADVHGASAHFKRIVPQFSAMFDEDEQVDQYTEYF